MKKMFAFMIAVMMLFSVCCAEPAEEKELIASWALVAMTDENGNELEGEVPPFYVGIYDDGTGYYETDEDAASEGTWEMLPDGTGFGITVADNYFEFIMDEKTGNISNEDPEDGSLMIFAPEGDMPAEINAESMDEFQGAWKVNAAVISGFYYDLSDANDEEMTQLFGMANPIITINGNQVTMPDGTAGTAVFNAGALDVTFGSNVVTICLTETGDITFPVDGGSISAVYAVK